MVVLARSFGDTTLTFDPADELLTRLEFDSTSADVVHKPTTNWYFRLTAWRMARPSNTESLDRPSVA